MNVGRMLWENQRDVIRALGVLMFHPLLLRAYHGVDLPKGSVKLKSLVIVKYKIFP